jgi:hypothetical protein
MSEPASWRTRVALFVVIAVAAALRFVALDYGRGIDARPDEPGVLMTLDMLGPGGATSPLLGLYGATFFVPLYAAMRLVGFAFPVPPGGVFTALVAVRAWSAALSTLAVWVTYRVGRRVGGAAVGVLAATMLAVSPLAVREAHSAKADTAAMTMTALWLLAALRPWPSARVRALGLGALAALVVDTKLLVGIVPALAFAVLEPDADGRRPWCDAAVALAALVAVTAALRWYVFVHPTEWAIFAPAILDTTRVSRFPGAADVPGPLYYHAVVSFRFGCGLAAALAMPLAFARAIGGRRELRLLAVAAGGILVPVLLSAVVLARFVLPALPALVVLVATTVMDAAARLPAPRRLVALAGATAILVAEPLASSAVLVRLLGRTDTRLEAADWIAAHVPPGSRVVTWGAVGFADFGSPPMPALIVRRGLPPGDWTDVDWLVVHRYPIPWSSATPPAIPPTFERVAVFSPYDGPTDAPILEPLDAFYLPLGHFGGFARPGPYIEVHRHVRDRHATAG